MNWDVTNEFFKTEHGKGLLKTASLKKEALDKDTYYDKSLQGPTRDEVKEFHPGGGTTTQVSVGGKGGEGVYDVKKTDIKAEQAHVETITEQQDVDLDVARKAPTGKQGAAEIKGLAKTSAKSKKDKMKKLRKMKKKCQLDSLVKLADHLDSLGLGDEANQIDSIIQEETAFEATESSDASE